VGVERRAAPHAAPVPRVLPEVVVVVAHLRDVRDLVVGVEDLAHRALGRGEGVAAEGAGAVRVALADPREGVVPLDVLEPGERVGDGGVEGGRGESGPGGALGLVDAHGQHPTCHALASRAPGFNRIVVLSGHRGTTFLNGTYFRLPHHSRGLPRRARSVVETALQGGCPPSSAESSQTLDETTTRGIGSVSSMSSSPPPSRLRQVAPWVCVAGVLAYVLVAPVLFTATGASSMWPAWLVGIAAVGLAVAAALIAARSSRDDLAAHENLVQAYRRAEERAAAASAALDALAKEQLPAFLDSEPAPPLPHLPGDAAAQARLDEAAAMLARVQEERVARRDAVQVAVVALSRKVQAAAHRIQEEAARMVQRHPT